MAEPTPGDQSRAVRRQCVRGRSLDRPPRASRFRCWRYSVVGTSSMPRIEAWSVPSLRIPSTVLGEV